MFAALAESLRRLGVPCRLNAPIAPHLHFRIGGAVRLLASPAGSGQLAAAVRELAAARAPFLVVGGGSNIVFGDGPTRAAVVLAPAPAPTRLLDDRSLQVESGMRNPPFLSWCAAQGIGGFEFLSGIPGTLGGAAAVNAGAFGRSVADVLLAADIVDEGGNPGTVEAGRFDFGYRGSRFKFGRETLLALRLRFDRDSGTAIARKLKENLNYRRKHHPSYRLASAGCFFKNPMRDGVKISAGKLIEECGLKGTACGGLVVAAEHGNFLLNRGGGTFADLRRLEETIREALAGRTGIVLEREVIYVSPEGKKY
ncbi:MAG: UDP-N-acetylmuramate dehydrogenase [Candidatus Aminicenantes bacterium]|nr:UDP-N-acetylmuramate dehydrogenase [Candidatus Aminicenantes bacterium]